MKNNIWKKKYLLFSMLVSFIGSWNPAYAQDDEEGGWLGDEEEETLLKRPQMEQILRKSTETQPKSIDRLIQRKRSCFGEITQHNIELIFYQANRSAYPRSRNKAIRRSRERTRSRRKRDTRVRFCAASIIGKY